MKKKVFWVVPLLMILILHSAHGAAGAAYHPNYSPPIEEELITSTWDTGIAYNGAYSSLTFTIGSSYRITFINTYHWNNQQGKRPGMIGLRAQSGVVYGPWQAAGTDGMYKTRNAVWEVRPNIVIPAGTYEVIDSDPSTWSQNDSTGGVGMSEVRGYIQERGRRR